MKKKYVIRYIDGNDLKYKLFETEARNKDEAIEHLWASYADMGDFEHRIASISCKPISLSSLFRV